jgi:Bacterial SH3 domain
LESARDVINNRRVMRVIGLVVLLALATTGSAFAEKVKTNQSAKLLNHPGERGKVIMKIKEGQHMTLLAREGRWLKVRVSGRTGYVPRSKVEMASEDELVRNTRRRPFVDGRSTKRGFGSEEGPDDRVGADATDPSSSSEDDDEDKPKKSHKSDDDEDKPRKSHKSDDDEDKPRKSHKSDDDDEDKPRKSHKSDDDEDSDDDDKPAKSHKSDDDVEVDDDDAGTEDAPEAQDKRPTAHVSEKLKVYEERDRDSEVSFVARPSDTLYPSDSKGKWTMVETDEGDAGWVLTSKLEMEDDDGGGGGPHKRIIDVRAGFGVTFIQQGMRTTGTTLTGTDQVPDIYNIGSSAGTIALRARVLFPYGKKYMLGGEALYDASKTLLGGVTYMGTSTGLTISDLNVRGVFAYPTKRKSGLMLLGRLGFRYRGYLVDNYQDATKNPAKIPQETLKAPTLGGAIVLPKLTDKVGLSVGVDAILFGASISQTEGLEDGATPSMSCVHATVGFVYRWKKDMDLQGAYDLDYASYDFGTPNMGAAMQSTRGHTGTDVARTDILHTVSFGIAKAW